MERKATKQTNKQNQSVWLFKIDSLERSFPVSNEGPCVLGEIAKELLGRERSQRLKAGLWGGRIFCEKPGAGERVWCLLAQMSASRGKRGREMLTGTGRRKLSTHKCEAEWHWSVERKMSEKSEGEGKERREWGLEICPGGGLLWRIFLIFGSHSTDDSLLWRARVIVDKQFRRLQVWRWLGGKKILKITRKKKKPGNDIEGAWASISRPNQKLPE